MLKSIRYFFYMLIISSPLVSANPTSYPDVTQIPPPIITLRNLFTGEPLRNNHYGERNPFNTHWEIVDVLAPEFSSKRDGGNFVQFRVRGTQNRCFSYLRITSCADLQSTLFSIIPTNTGAFAIKDVTLGFCFISTNFRNYALKPCGKTLRGQTLPLTHLWTFSPPFNTTRLLSVPR